MATKKISEQDKIEADNLIEEIKGVLEPCIKCGMCKSLCPVFKVFRQEEYSARGQVILLNEEILDNIIFECNLCRACEVKCPLGIKVCEAIKKAREVMVLKGKELKQNKDMIENIRKKGNPFGDDVGKSGDKFYCC